MDYIFIFVLIAVCVVLIYILDNKSKFYRSSISFKEAMDLVGLPIITLNVGAKKLNFVLDTGSNFSYINKSVLSDINHEQLNVHSEIYGIDGKAIRAEHYRIQMQYKDQTFVEEFHAADLDDAMEAIKQESGVKVHGLLGSKFFEKYNYILDFNTLVAHNKRSVWKK